MRVQDQSIRVRVKSLEAIGVFLSPEADMRTEEGALCLPGTLLEEQ